MAYKVINPYDIERVKFLNIIGFYAGYFSLILREIPFSCIQFPIYEYMKKRTLEKYHTMGFWHSGYNGFVSAAIGFQNTYY